MRNDMTWALRALGSAGLLLACATVTAADLEAGKATANARCIQCHEADDWDGEDAASLESLIRDIVAGKVKHRQKIDLSPAEVANVAAFWAESSK
jgi:mono/diheme cytochrome c family protein